MNELSRIFKHIADRISRGILEGQIIDINGNHVGYWIWDRIAEKATVSVKTGNAAFEE